MKVTAGVAEPSGRIESETASSKKATYDEIQQKRTATVADSFIRWTIAMPEGRNVFRDFLEENFLLWATISWKATPCLGRITLRPVDIQFFSPKRRTLGFFHSSVMDIVASRRHTDAAGKDGIIVEFSLGDK